MAEENFAGWITYVDQWVKGTSFQWDVPLENLPLPTQTLASAIATDPAAPEGMTAVAAGNALLSGAVLTPDTNVPLAPDVLTVTLADPVADLSELGSLSAVRVLPQELLALPPEVTLDPGTVYWLSGTTLRPLAQAQMETLLPQAGSVTLAANPNAPAGAGADANQPANTAPQSSNIPADDLDNLTRAALIPIFIVIAQVEGMEAVTRGALDGFKAGLEDDYQMLTLLGKGLVFVGGLTAQGMGEIASWKTDRKKRAEAFLALAGRISEEFVFKPIREFHQEISTWEGFKRRAFQLYELQNKFIDFHLQAFVVAKDNAPKLVDAMTSWMDDFGNRMLVESENTVFANAAWNKDTLVGDFMEQGRFMAYTFGHTFGYIVEQVLSGVVQAGVGKIATKMATVLAKGTAGLAGSVLKRGAGAVAARMHWVKRLLEESGMGDALLRAAYEKGLVKCAVEPVGPTIKEAIFEVLEKAFSREGFQRSIYSWKHLQDDILQRPNLSKLIKQQGGEAVFQRRLSQLATILGDEFDAVAARNFAKVADDFIVVPRPDGTVDEFFEGFFKAMEGNPSLMKQADDVAIGVGGTAEPLSQGAKARLKQLLRDPIPGEPHPEIGNPWRLDEVEDWTVPRPIPGNFWARGNLIELWKFKKSYKPKGFEHHPNAPGYDYPSAGKDLFVQMKSYSNPDGAAGAAREALDKLRDAVNIPAGAKLQLHIVHKKGTSSTSLSDAIEAYLGSAAFSNEQRSRFLPTIFEEFVFP